MPRMPGMVTIFYRQDHKKIRQGEEGRKKALEDTEGFVR
jgi:hypothetical protein